MGSSPATVAKGRPGSCTPATPALQTLAGFSEDHPAYCGQAFEGLWQGLGREQGIPVAILGPICVPCFVIGRWAVLAPPHHHHHSLSVCVLFANEECVPQAEKSNKKLRANF